MEEVLDFYSKNDLKNGSFQTLVDELVLIGYSESESLNIIKKHFNIK